MEWFRPFNHTLLEHDKEISLTIINSPVNKDSGVTGRSSDILPALKTRFPILFEF